MKRQTECRRHFKTALLRLLPGRFVPRCKADGSYDPTQCVGSVCLCVDSRGIAIPGTSKARFIKPNCESQGTTILIFFLQQLNTLFFFVLGYKQEGFSHSSLYFSTPVRLETVKMPTTVPRIITLLRCRTLCSQVSSRWSLQRSPVLQE